MSIYKKLSEAKKEIGKISKDSTNPFFNSKYFDINSLLEHVEPILQKQGLVITQPLFGNSVTTNLADVETGEHITSSLQLPELSDPQKMGSAITYYRRYTLQSLLALQAEDDDANTASGNTKDANNKKFRQADDRPWLNEGSKEWKEIKLFIENGQLTSVDQITKYKMSKKTRELLTRLINI